MIGGSAVPTPASPIQGFQEELVALLPQLRAFARSLCGRREQADDLVQEAAVRAWAARSSFTPGTSMRAWTFTILRNAFYSEVRRARFKGDYDEGVAERVLRTPASQDDAVELGDVLRALHMIPDTYREALMLVAVGSHSYEEIAQICGIALGTVKSRICRARAMLSNALESGQLPDFRHNFVLTRDVIDTYFDELARIANANSSEAVAA